MASDTLRTLGQRPGWVLAGLGLLLAGLFVLSVGTGAVSIAPAQVLAILAKALGGSLPWGFDAQQQAIVLAIRLPRALLGMLIGGGLAIAGTAMQGLFRNPLADPGLLGVSSGAAVAVVGLLVLGATWLSFLPSLLGPFTLPVAAFAGGVGTTFLVYRLAAREGQVGVSTLLLAGIAINAFAGALIGILTFLADDAQLRNLTFWSLGSLGGATWGALGASAPFILLSIICILRYARPLNALLLGEAEAGHLGFEVEKLKRVLVLFTALAVGSAVAVAGIIGFVGLIVPHLLRLSAGPDHRLLLPGAALLGAALLLGADLIARTIVAPAELPIGIVTALVGGPFFLCLLERHRRREQH